MSEEPRVLAAPNMNDEINKAVRDALDPADIRAAIIAEAEKQGLASAEAVAAQAAADKVAADAAAAEAAHAAEIKEYTRTEVIGGQEFNFSASTEIELERMVNNAYRVAYAVQKPEAPATVVDPAIAAAAAQKETEAQAAHKAELELKFRSGDITAAEYIEQSGALVTAMNSYLESQGVSLDAIKKTVAKTEETAESQSWADAVETFKNSPAGMDWPGGEKNLDIIGTKVIALGLESSEDKVAALAQAYAEMKRTGTIFSREAETPIPNTAERIAAEMVAKTAADKLANDAAIAARAAAAVHASPRAASTSSSLFGQSSGVSSVPAKTAADAEATVEVPKELSPAEIMDAWKKSVIAQGGNPDAALHSTFSGRAR